MKKQNWYGLLGFLSLLGWIGVFTQERVFLLFFAFAVDFQYFFLPSDEMLEESMARCAARGISVWRSVDGSCGAAGNGSRTAGGGYFGKGLCAGLWHSGDGL